MMFDAEKVKEACVLWIREFFKENGPDCNAVIGISGGKDSSTVAALCVEALGAERVIGVLMPNGIQSEDASVGKRMFCGAQVASRISVPSFSSDVPLPPLPLESSSSSFTRGLPMMMSLTSASMSGVILYSIWSPSDRNY